MGEKRQIEREKGDGGVSVEIEREPSRDRKREKAEE